MEKGVIEMRKRAETFSGKEEVEKLAESLEKIDSDGQARQKQAAEKADAALAAVKRDAAGVEARVDALFSGAKEARVRLGEHGQLIEESKGRLDSCEVENAALRDELKEKMAMLEEREAKWIAKQEEAGRGLGGWRVGWESLRQSWPRPLRRMGSCLVRWKSSHATS